MKRKLFYSLFAMASLAWLMGGDCELEIEDIGWPFWGYPVYVEPAPIFVEPIFCDPFGCF